MNVSVARHRVSLLPQLVVMGALIAAFWRDRWALMVACVGILLLMNIPFLLRSRTLLPLSPNTRVAISLLLFAWLFLGEIWNYYLLFTWWDLLLHAFAGFVIGLVGVRLAHNMTASRDCRQWSCLSFAAAFGLSAALAVGALWEILEFGLDKWLQKDILKPMLGDESGLTDTIFDLIADGAGALFACIYGLCRIKSSPK